MKQKLLALLGAIVLLAVSFILDKSGAVSFALSGTARQETLIILDPGHGGVDPGAVGNNVIEKDINLSIALTLRDILQLNGYSVIMTRETDISINNKELKKISQIKSSDLKNRLKLIDEHEGAITIMIHQNKFEQAKYSGAQMFYGQKNEESRMLAQVLQSEFKARLQPDNERQIKPSTSAVYILHNSKNPIVLAECGFVSNPDEAQLLLQEEYRQKIAFTIFCGIEEYLKQE